MPWYKVRFTKGKSKFGDSRNIYAQNKRLAGTALKEDWKKSTGSTIRILKVTKRS